MILGVIAAVLAVLFLMLQVVLFLMDRAPEGYEDRDGFHYGRER